MLCKLKLWLLELERSDVKTTMGGRFEISARKAWKAYVIYLINIYANAKRRWKLSGLFLIDDDDQFKVPSLTHKEVNKGCNILQYYKSFK